MSHVRLHDFRSYGRQELELAQGLVLVVGPNGAGKTNLLEGIHLGSQGFSFRTRRDAGVVRFGTDTARVELRGLVREATPFATQITVARGARSKSSSTAQQSRVTKSCAAVSRCSCSPLTGLPS